tara:strand:- start:148 stop:492 length:345 start_codon:yes stop_codon:yes gene_type:complete
MSKHWNKWISPLYAGALHMPEKVRESLGWGDDDIVLMEMVEGEDGKELRVSKCKEVDVLDVEMWFEDYVAKVEMGEVFVIKHGVDRVLFMPPEFFSNGVELNNEWQKKLDRLLG